MRRRRCQIELIFVDEELARTCRNDDAACRHWGPERWPLVRSRLALLLAADRMEDLVDATFVGLSARSDGGFLIPLWPGTVIACQISQSSPASSPTIALIVTFKEEDLA